ncbi:MAG: hypothetical protein DDT27_00964 [Dehalococcoidia bacterium]|nr:hypothetical protein [Chloroflexota bacterium]
MVFVESLLAEMKDVIADAWDKEDGCGIISGKALKKGGVMREESRLSLIKM